jgi:hypothetical protein
VGRVSETSISFHSSICDRKDWARSASWIRFFGLDHHRIKVGKKIGEALHRCVHGRQDVEYIDGRVFDGLKDANNLTKKKTKMRNDGEFPLHALINQISTYCQWNPCPIQS